MKLEDYDRIVPKENEIAIIRDERPLTAHGIWIPDRARTLKRSSVATIIAVGEKVVDLCPGMRVLLYSGVGRKLSFGRRDEKIVEFVKPTMCIAEVKRVVTRADDHILKGMTPGEIAGPDPAEEIIQDEGEPDAWYL